MNSADFDSWLNDPSRQPLLMGVINATPDSFSDGGRFSTPEEAVNAALAMIDAGAEWIDVGGESTRPGSMPVSADEQIRRAVPVISGLRRETATLISIDTMDGRVAEAALDAGANVVNDVSAGRVDKNMLGMVAKRKSSIILMHMLGSPATMQTKVFYENVTRDVHQFLIERREAAVEAGIDRSRILFDPGLGFGKTVSHNLKLLHDAKELAALGQPLVMGASRKSFIGKVTSKKVTGKETKEEDRSEDRLLGTAATVAWCVANQTAVVRIHDVEAMAQVVRMIRAITTAI